MNIKNEPRVSVIMAAYNAEKYLAEAMESILNQTEKNLELIVVDDGSKDRTEEIIKKFNDKRIVFIKNDSNKGSVYSRNLAVEKSRGQYIAILDSDDIALKNRLEIECDFLDKHPEFGVVGSAVRLIGPDGLEKGGVWKNTLPSRMIPGILLFQNYLANSSSVFRKEALPQKPAYRDMEPADDYDLWSRIDKNKWKIWNLPEVLVKYRIHGNNINIVLSDKKEKVINQIIREALAKLDIFPTDDELKTHRANYFHNPSNPKLFLSKREKWLAKIKQQNDLKNVYVKKDFDAVITERWLSSCSANWMIGFSVWRLFWKSELSKKIPFILYPAVIRFLVKIFLKYLGRK